MPKKNASSKTQISNKKKTSAKPSWHSRKKNVGNISTAMTIGDISGINGELNIAGRDIKVRKTTEGVSTAEIQQLFDHLYQTIESRMYALPREKAAVAAEIKEIQSAVTAGSPRDKKTLENFLFLRLRNIASMAPDVLDVVMQTLANPVLGLGEVARKIAKKSKEQPNA